MEAKRIVSESDKKEFNQKVLAFVAEKGWTIKNLNDAILEVNEYLENNAILKEVNFSNSIKNTENDFHKGYAVVEVFNGNIIKSCLTKEEAACFSMSVKTPTKIVESEFIF